MASAFQSIDRAAEARAELDAYLALNSRKSLLRFLTCGSVDDGKSTLIGRLLYDTHALFEDQLATLEVDSGKSGTQGPALDMALLVDGLAAEREQGITIDVAYRFFSTPKRKFIVADTPGHEQFTRNMVTGASTAELAVLLIDARKGVLTQTRRHSFLVDLLGIKSLVLAVNKMDLVGFSQARFDEIVADYRAFADQAGIGEFVAIPVVGLSGDNVASRSASMPWYDGPSLIEHLENVPVAVKANGKPGADNAPFRMAVQWVNRPNAAFRGYAGQIASGVIRSGDDVSVSRSGQSSRVERIVSFNGDLDVATAGQSITLTLADELDIARGDLLGAVDAPVALASGLDSTLVWMAEERLVLRRSYLMKIGTQMLSASVDAIEQKIDVDTLVRSAAESLGLNDIGECRVELDRAIPALAYGDNRQLGAFILIDKVSHATVAAGMIRAVRTSTRTRAAEDDEASRIVWIGGASPARRGTLIDRLKQQLQVSGHPVFVLDGAALRDLNEDLAGEPSGETVRRARSVARLLARAGVNVIVDVAGGEADAHPGKWIDADAPDADASDDWVI
jgi:bifunctional enzyme CysN/CysC